MVTRWGYRLSGGAVALLLGGAGCHPIVQGKGDARGAGLYTAYCASCHGPDGRNDRSGALPQMRLSNSARRPVSELAAIIREGRGQMPAFRNRLSDVDIDALAQQIKQFHTD